jgi:predicted amidohydrolase YtcJ
VDLVVLPRDPLAMTGDDLATTRPLATMLGGHWVFDRRQP